MANVVFPLRDSLVMNGIASCRVFVCDQSVSTYVCRGGDMLQGFCL